MLPLTDSLLSSLNQCFFNNEDLEQKCSTLRLVGWQSGASLFEFLAFFGRGPFRYWPRRAGPERLLPGRLFERPPLRPPGPPGPRPPELRPPEKPPPPLRLRKPPLGA